MDCAFSHRSRGMTLLELLTVVVILATLGGAALFALSGAEQSAREDVRTIELVRIRDAVLRFRADTGQTPRLLAELMQSPDPADELGGWWWRGAGDPPLPAARFDPATRLGWDGPYLRAEHRTPSVAGQFGEGRESRVDDDGSVSNFDSDASAGRGLAMLLSAGQPTGVARILSDWRLDLSDEDEAGVEFLGVGAKPALAPASLGLGVRP